MDQSDSALVPVFAWDRWTDFNLELILVAAKVSCFSTQLVKAASTTVFGEWCAQKELCLGLVCTKKAKKWR